MIEKKNSVQQWRTSANINVTKRDLSLKLSLKECMNFKIRQNEVEILKPWQI